MTQTTVRSLCVLKAQTKFLTRVMMPGKWLSYPKVTVSEFDTVDEP